MPSTQSTAQKALAISLGLFLLAMLVRGGNTPNVVAMSAVLGVAVFLVAGLSVWFRRSLTVSYAFAAFAGSLLLVLAMGLLGLAHVDAQAWLRLPGHDIYKPALAVLEQQGIDSSSIAISLDPSSTVRAVLAAVTACAVALAAYLLPREMALKVLGGMLVLTLFQAVLGIAQFALGSPEFLVQDSAYATRAVGTFVNKNHFATLMAMSLPLLLMRASGQLVFFRSTSQPTSLSNVWWGFATVVAAVALTASLSRAGSTAGFAVAVVTIAFCAWKTQSQTRRLAFLGIVVVALAMASVSSLDRLLASMTGSALAESVAGRQWLNDNTFAAAKQFWPLGAGLGTYSIAFQRFQTPDFVGFPEHAHNDYAQIVFELGAAGVAVLMGLALAAVLVGASLLRARTLSPAVGCYLGAVAFAIHAWFDFPAHIPGVAITVCMLFAFSMNPALANVAAQQRQSRKTDAESASTVRRKRRSRARAARPDSELGTVAPVNRPDMEPVAASAANPWIVARSGGTRDRP